LINKALGLNVPEPVETYSSSPHFFADLEIPKGTKGRLQRAKKSAPAEGDGSPRRDESARTPRRRSSSRTRTRTVNGEQKHSSQGGAAEQDGARHGHSKGKQDRPARENERHRETHVSGEEQQAESGATARRRRPRRRTRSTEDGGQD